MVQWVIPQKIQVVKGMEFPGVLKIYYVHLEYPGVIKKKCVISKGCHMEFPGVKLSFDNNFQG